MQALTLLNDPVYVEAAEALAKRIVADMPSADVGARIEHALKLCIARAPTPRELAVLKTLYEQSESDGWNAVATALLNLDETLTKS